MLLLAALVLGVGVVSWLATGGIGRIAPPATTPSPIARTSPSPSPTFLPLSLPTCTLGQLALGGAFNDCAAKAPNAASFCSVSAHVLDAVITLQGGQRNYLLYVEVDGNYNGHGMYTLKPWHAGLDTNDGTAKVAVREYTTGALWQSVAGGLSVLGNDGRSGSMDSDLTFTGGEATSPLRIAGLWSC